MSALAPSQPRTQRSRQSLRAARSIGIASPERSWSWTFTTGLVTSQLSRLGQCVHGEHDGNGVCSGLASPQRRPSRRAPLSRWRPSSSARAVARAGVRLAESNPRTSARRYAIEDVDDAVVGSWQPPPMFARVHFRGRHPDCALLRVRDGVPATPRCGAIAGGDLTTDGAHDGR